jgi:hypothetical protein
MSDKAMEEAYMVRDLVGSQEGRQLYDIMKTMSRVRMAIIYDDLKEGRPVVLPSGGRGREPLSLAEYSAYSGELRGLEWVFYHVDSLVRKADREDARRASEPVKEGG